LQTRALESTHSKGADLQIVVGDGLSAQAAEVQVPGLLPQLHAGAAERGWSAGVPFAVRHCRVGVMNDVGLAYAAKGGSGFGVRLLVDVARAVSAEPVAPRSDTAG